MRLRIVLWTLVIACLGSACATGGEPRESEEIREEPIADHEGEITLDVEYEDGPFLTIVAEQAQRCEQIKEVTVEEDGESTTREEKVGTVDCGTKPAGDIDVIVSGPERDDDIMQVEDAETFSVRLNQDGKARIRITPGEWPGYHLVEEFATIDCYGVQAECEPFEMTLPAEQAARFARSSNQPDELARWLQLYEGHEMEADIREELEEDERYREAEELRDEVDEHLEADELTEAHGAVEECFELIPSYDRCRVLEEELSEAIEKINLERITELGVTERGGKLQLYFGLADADGKAVRVPGKVEWGLEADGSYRKIATAQVTREDFERRQVPGADKETLIFVETLDYDEFIEPTTFESWEEAKRAFEKEGGDAIEFVVTFEPLLQSSVEASTSFDP
ncbi:MAG: hypothetical protein ACOCV2_04710 [Persicimonas sp.]